MLNGLDPDQDRQNGPNCLQSLSADDKVVTSKERVATEMLAAEVTNVVEILWKF